MTPREQTRPSDAEDMTGVPASPGVAVGPVHLLDTAPSMVPERFLEPHELPSEVRRLRKALRKARDEVAAVCQGIADTPDDPGLQLLAAHRLLLEDLELHGRLIDGIKEERLSAETAVGRTFSELIAHMENSVGAYFQARSEDMRDVMHRLLRHLLDWEVKTAAAIPKGVILVAPELSPSESVCLDPRRVIGIATDHGGPTNHAAIMARSRGIPAVLGLGNITARVRDGDRVILDGTRGRVVLRPVAKDVLAVEKERAKERRARSAMSRLAPLPSMTQDLQRIPLLANIEVPADAEMALREGAEGIGLYRTEFFHLLHIGWPTEDEQHRAYRRVVRIMKKRPVIIRTIDVGGDKFAVHSGIGREGNPFLGMRGIRFSLAHPEIFSTQVRAIMRAGIGADVRILLPMVTSLDEVREVRGLIGGVRKEMAKGGMKIKHDDFPLGVMIETPSMVLLSDLLALEVDFLSIGSNDLIQYTLAADRGNEKVAHLYDPFHPAVLRSIYRTVQSGHRAGISVSSCGEMSADPMGVLVLLGLGVDSLSVAPSRLKPVKQLIRTSTMQEVRRHVESALTCATSSEVRDVLRRAFPAAAQATGLWVSGGGGRPA
jgi:phosphotransferase system enzyme I (PtsI)